MEAVDSIQKPRAVEPQAKRSAELSRDAAQLGVVSRAVVSAAREVCARSQQIVSMIEKQRRLRSPDVVASWPRQDRGMKRRARAANTDRRRTTPPAVIR